MLRPDDPETLAAIAAASGKALPAEVFDFARRSTNFSTDQTAPFVRKRVDGETAVCARVRSIADGTTHWQTASIDQTEFRSQVAGVLPMLTHEMVLDFHVKERAAVARAVVHPCQQPGLFTARMGHTPMAGEHAVAVRYTFQQVVHWVERAFCLLSNIEYPNVALYSSEDSFYECSTTPLSTDEVASD
jgi:hypothetical protein